MIPASFMSSIDHDNDTEDYNDSSSDMIQDSSYSIHAFEPEHFNNIAHLTHDIKAVNCDKLLTVKNNIFLMSIDEELVIAMLLYLPISDAYSIMHPTIIKSISRNVTKENNTTVIYSSRVFNVPFSKIYEIYEKIFTDGMDYVFVSRFKKIYGDELDGLMLDFPEISIKDLQKLPCNVEELLLINLADKIEIIKIVSSNFRIITIKSNKICAFMDKLREELETERCETDNNSKIPS